MPLWVELALLLLCIVFGARLVGTVLAAVSFDQNGATRIGMYLLNQCHMRRAPVSTGPSTLIALVFDFLPEVGP